MDELYYHKKELSPTSQMFYITVGVLKGVLKKFRCKTPVSGIF